MNRLFRMNECMDSHGGVIRHSVGMKVMLILLTWKGDGGS